LDKDKVIFELMRKVESLTMRVSQLESFDIDNKKLRFENEQIKAENAELKAEIAELRNRLNRNSSNSSKPPSSDGYQKKPALVKGKNGKQGGQKGHKGKTLEQSGTPDYIINCKPDTCSCGHVFTTEEMKLSEKRQVFDLPPPRLEITEYRSHKTDCPICGKTCKAPFPEGINATDQYGPRIKSQVVLLNVHYMLPFKKIQQLCNDLFGYSINESTVYSANQSCYEKLELTEELVKSKIIDSTVAHADETGIRVKGKLHWLHTASTIFCTYLFVHEKRGGQALTSEKSILGKLRSWLVHDCRASYFNFIWLNTLSVAPIS
jgi:transposase